MCQSAFAGRCALVIFLAGAGWVSRPLPAHEDESHSHPRPVKVAEAQFHRPSPVPDRIVLTWCGDPATTQAVNWRTDTSVAEAFAEIAPAEEGPLFAIKGTRHPAITTVLESDLGISHYHSVRFDQLTPKTTYAYRVGDGVNWSEWIQFRTASDQPEPFSFVYFGDSQNDLRSLWSRVVREAYRDAPKAAFFLHAGDLINKSTRDAEWGEWFQAGGFIQSMVPCVPTPGNHEYGTKALAPHWRHVFTLPENGPPELAESVYWIDFQGVRLISLNSNERREEQVEWLTRVLSDQPQRWTIVTFHHPVYSGAKGRENTTLRNLWQPIFDKYRVDLVLQGHDHVYARSGLMAWENVPSGVTQQSPAGGTVYVVSVSGPKMYRADRRPMMRRVAENTQLYQIIHVGDQELRYEARTATGTLYDAFTLRKREGETNELIDQIPERPERRWTDGPAEKK